MCSENPDVSCFLPLITRSQTPRSGCPTLLAHDDKEVVILEVLLCHGK